MGNSLSPPRNANAATFMTVFQKVYKREAKAAHTPADKDVIEALNARMCLIAHFDSHLYANFDGLLKEGDMAAVQACVEAALAVPDLICLILNNCHIDAAKVSLLKPLVATHPLFHHMHISFNPLGVEGAAVLAEVLLESRSLHSLYMRHVDAGSAGIIKILEALSTLPKFQILDVAGNGIESSAMSALTALSLDPKVVGLCVLHNKLSRNDVALLEGNIANNLARFDIASLINQTCGHHVVHGDSSESSHTVGVSDLQGRRPTMEDAMVVSYNFGGQRAEGGGEGGAKGANGRTPHSHDHGHSHGQTSGGRGKGSVSSDGSLSADEDGGTPGTQVRSGLLVAIFDGHGDRAPAVLAADHLVRELERARLAHRASFEKAFSKSYKALNSIIQSRTSFCGTTALTVLLTETEVLCANAGDTRCVLAREGTALRLSKDHKPNDEAERRRIQDLGGSVERGRVSGQLAVSRALGDGMLSPFVSHVPFVSATGLEAGDTFVILACDGVWDLVTDSFAVSIVETEFTAGLGAQRLRNIAYNMGSTDNISVVVVSVRTHVETKFNGSIEASVSTMSTDDLDSSL